MVKEDFEQALLDVKPVSMGSCDLIMMSLSPSGIWCEQRQLDDYISNGELNNIDCTVYVHVYIRVKVLYNHMDFNLQV